jgi:hypothetical protein
MEITVARNGQTFGPYPLDQINTYLVSGQLLHSDLAWHDGLADWKPLGSLEGITVAAPPPPRPIQPVVGPVGIGGWMILPVIGLILTPFMVGYTLWSNFLPVLEPETWAYLTTPDSEGYHALWTPLILYELIGNAVIGISAIVLLILMFKHHPALPACMVIYYVAALVFVVVDEIASTYIPAIGAQTDAASYRELGRSVRDVAIWVPYFLKSKRVKNTFRREGGVHVHRPQPSLPDDVPKSEPVDKPGF